MGEGEWPEAGGNGGGNRPVSLRRIGWDNAIIPEEEIERELLACSHRRLIQLTRETKGTSLVFRSEIEVQLEGQMPNGCVQCDLTNNLEIT